MDELFSYSADHLIEIYSSSGVYINQANKEVTLNIGFNKFQVAFKNLKNYSEIIYNFNIFRDPGTVTRKVNQYDVKKEMTKSMQDNGLPSYKFKFYYPYNEYVTYDGIKVPALITECNIQIQFSAYFFVDSNNFLPGSYSPHQHTEQLLLNYEFNDVSEYPAPSNFRVKVVAVKNGCLPSDVAEQEFTLPGYVDVKTGEYKQGDVNKDGNVNVADHVKLSGILLGNK